MTIKLKLSVQEFGELCNSILDAFERGEVEIPTTWGVNLVGHIEAVYKEQKGIEQERDIRGEFLDRVVALAQKRGFAQNGWLDSIDYLETVFEEKDAEIERLKTALKPFAELAQTYAACEHKWHGEGEPSEPFLEWLNWRDDDEIRAACEQASAALGS